MPWIGPIFISRTLAFVSVSSSLMQSLKGLNTILVPSLYSRHSTQHWVGKTAVVSAVNHCVRYGSILLYGNAEILYNEIAACSVRHRETEKSNWPSQAMPTAMCRPASSPMTTIFKFHKLFSTMAVAPLNHSSLLLVWHSYSNSDFWKMHSAKLNWQQAHRNLWNAASYVCAWWINTTVACFLEVSFYVQSDPPVGH